MKTVENKPVVTPDDIVMRIQRSPSADELERIEKFQKDRQNPESLPNLQVPLTPLTVARWVCQTAEMDTVEKAAKYLDLYKKLKSIPDSATTVSFEDEEYSIVRKVLVEKAPSTWGFLAPLVVAAFEQLTDPVSSDLEG